MTAFGLAAVCAAAASRGARLSRLPRPSGAAKRQRRSGLMGFKSKAAVAVSGALTAGAFATLAAAVPASAATYGTEQSEGGVVFAVGANSAIVGAGNTGRNTEFTQTQQGNRV